MNVPRALAGDGDTFRVERTGVPRLLEALVRT